MNEDFKSYKINIRNILLKFILPASVACLTFFIDFNTGVIVSVVALFWAYYHELSSVLLGKELLPLKRVGEIIEITSNNLSNGTIKELMSLSLIKIDNELDSFRNEIILTAIKQLKDISLRKTCAFSSSSKFYRWILERVDQYNHNDFVEAIFVYKEGSLPINRDETEREKKFIRSYISAMKRGVNIRRYFIGNRHELHQFFDGGFAEFILAHIDELESRNTSGFFVDKNELINTEPVLLKEIGDGFTIFNKKSVVCDNLTSAGPRGTLMIDSEKHYNGILENLDYSYAVPLREVLNDSAVS